MKNILLKMLIIVFFSIEIFAQGTQNILLNKATGSHSESFQSFTFDGAWCWFSDPRAVYYEGKHKRTYAGWIDSHGDVTIGYYDHTTNKIKTKVLEDNYEIDDHDNPSLIFTPEGKLMVFFTKHGGPNPFLLFTMKSSEDIDSWERNELFLNDTELYSEFTNTNTYANPVILSEENNRIYLFWRGIDNKPNFSFSDDMGKSWSKSKIFVLPNRIYNMRRPYMKVASNGKNKIMFAFTDGHPRDENENSIYYMYYKNGKFYNAENREIGILGKEPISPNQSSIVYNASLTKVKSWIWDIAVDENDNPVIVYAKFPDSKNHIYVYAKWNGEKWISSDLINAGAWFPQTPQGKIEYEQNYSGGIILDHENTNIVYLSAKRDSVFEIEKWETKNGIDWEAKSITNGSIKDNVRPFAVRNAKSGNPIQLLWMQNSHYVHYTNYLSSIKIDLKPFVNDEVYNVENIKNLMRQTADWQLSNPFISAHRLDWHWGAFYIGLAALYETVKEERYLNEIINIGQTNDWKIIADVYHADRLAISDVYTWLYEIYKDPKIIDKSKWAMDIHLARDPKTDIRFQDNNYKLEWWTWCDALFMAPPSFARIYKATNEIKYLDYADKHWWITSDYLYSKNDSLYFRDDRFFDKKTSNGKKVFWGRGNGWVIAGLARMLKFIPETYPTREKYIQQFKEMAEKLLKLQRGNGLWTASLLDPEELPLGESSGSSFYTFALTWGINNNFLERERFEPAVKKAWKALTKNINEWGRLGFVQQVAGDPYPFHKDQWHVYATGAFLLCGKEIIELLEKE
ncbi:MAG: glycoside hydrolase family 88 protein [Ignavibacteriae bacterium]|nr:glycoside hydrolase family 88 protein [Ignavibacteriota bacterium]